MNDNRDFHLIIVDKSQKDVTAVKRFDILSQTNDEDWVIYKLRIKENNLKDTVRFLQENLNNGNWYFHAYNEDGSKLIVVFKNRIFHTDKDSNHWNTIIDYGVSQGTPKEQLDFSPNTFASETY